MTPRSGVRALLEVSRHLDSSTGLEPFFGRLCTTVAELVSAGRVGFGRYDEELGMIGPQRDFYGPEAANLAEMRIPCVPGGNGLAEQIVFGELVFRAHVELGDPAMAAYRDVLAALGVRDIVGVAWRAGDRRLGMLAALDSQRPGGFSEEDASVLQIAAGAAGLVWQQRQAEEALAYLEAGHGDSAALVARLSSARADSLEAVRVAIHEMRSPVTLLRGYLSMLSDGTLTAQRLAEVAPVLLGELDAMDRRMAELLERMTEGEPG